MTRQDWRVAGATGLLAMAHEAAASTGRLGGGGGDVAISIWRVFAAFLLCVAVAIAFVFVIKARGLPMKPWASRFSLGKLPLRLRNIDVVETRRLSPHADISLVRQGGREYLLLLSAGRSRLLHESAVVEDDPANELGGAA